MQDRARAFALAVGVSLAGAAAALILAHAPAGASPAPSASASPSPSAVGSGARSSVLVPAAAPTVATSTAPDGSIYFLGPNGETLAGLAPPLSIIAPSPSPTFAVDASSLVPAADPLPATGPDVIPELGLAAALLAGGVVFVALGETGVVMGSGRRPRRRAH